jgi:phosphatidate phosphatase APP1
VPASRILRIEDLIQRGRGRLLRRLGRPVRVHPFPGLAAQGSARIGGRVLVAAGPPPEPPARVTTWSALRANLGQFLTVEIPHAEVRVDLGGRSVVASADREGYLDLLLDDVPLDPGRHTAIFTPVDPPGLPARGTVHVPDAAADLVVVSDIDDTIVDSGIAHGVLATIATALLRDQATRVPLAGATELYQALARGAGGPTRPFVYLSTSPWNLLGFLQRFLERHRFPDGPLVLTDWGPGSSGLFRVGTRAHKLAALENLARLLPRMRFVLVGDSGQQDADIYTAFALEHPGRVAAVYIRRAAGGGAAREERLRQCARSLNEAEVPLLIADDSSAMLAHARALGLARA